MKKNISVSLVTILAICATNAVAADSLEGAFKEGKVTGTVKAVYLKTTLTDEGAAPSNASSFAVGGKLKYETASLYGVTAGAEFMTTNELGLGKSNSNTAQIFGGAASKNNQDDPTILMNDSSGSVLGQAYVQYVAGKTIVKIGRQELDTPLAGPKETRLLPTTFQAAVVINKDIANTTLIGAYVTAQKERQSDKFVTMGKAAFANGTNGMGALGGLGATGGLGITVPGNTYGTGTGLTLNDANALNNALDSKVLAVAAIYTGISGTTLQAWNYRASDVLNAIYLQADYTTKIGGANVFAAVQYLKENDIGSFDRIFTINGDAFGVDSSLLGFKAGFGISGAKLSVAYTQVSDSSAKNFGGIIAPWDGTPAFTDSANNNNLPGLSLVDGVGTVYGGSYAAGSKNIKVQADYDFASMGIKGLTGMVSYAQYDRQFKATATKIGMQGYDVNEWNIMAKYAFAGGLKGLSVIGMIIPMDVQANDATQTLTGTKSDRTQYRGFVTYNF